MAKYKNKLGLEGIPFIEGMQAKPGFLSGLFDGADDEFIHITDTLEKWEQEGKCLADFVSDEAQRDALLRDLYKLKKLKELELKSGELQKVSDRGTVRVENFLKEILPYEKGMLLAWEGTPERKSRFGFERFRGYCLLTYQDGAVIKLRLELQDKGLYYVAWIQADDIGQEEKPIAEDIKIDKAAPFIIQLAEPKRSGKFLIYRKSDTLQVEEIPA